MDLENTEVGHIFNHQGDDNEDDDEIGGEEVVVSWTGLEASAGSLSNVVEAEQTRPPPTTGPPASQVQGAQKTFKLSGI